MLNRHSSMVAPLALPHPFLFSFLLPSWRDARSCRPHLEERDPIWGDEWSHSLFIRRSPSWGFLGFFSAVRQMSGDLYTAPSIISLSSLSLATDVTDATLGAWPLARNPDRSWWPCHTNVKLFWPQPTAPCTPKKLDFPLCGCKIF